MGGVVIPNLNPCRKEYYPNPNMLNLLIAMTGFWYF